MFQTLLITFREGLEAFLILAIATLYLRKTGRYALIGAVRVGLAVAVAGSVALRPDGPGAGLPGGACGAWQRA